MAVNAAAESLHGACAYRCAGEARERLRAAPPSTPGEANGAASAQWTHNEIKKFAHNSGRRRGEEAGGGNRDRRSVTRRRVTRRRYRVTHNKRDEGVEGIRQSERRSVATVVRPEYVGGA